MRHEDVGHRLGPVPGAHEIGPQDLDPARDLFSRSNWDCRLDDHQISLAQHRRDRARGGLDIGEIGLVAAGKRRGYGNDVDVAGAWLNLGAYAPSATSSASASGR